MKHPIVILHGWGLSARVFEPLAKLLRSRGFRVYVPDFPGFGNAGIPKRPLFLADYVDFLSKYLQKNNIKEPIIIGHSFGGRVTLKFQERYPDAASALILTGTPGYTPVPKKKLMLLIAIAKIGKLFFLIPFINYFQERVRKWYYYVAGARDYSRAEGAMRDTFKNIVREELVTSMREIRVPTLLVWGEKDIIVPINIARRMKETIKDAKLIVVPNIGHALPYKNPKEFVRTIYDFLLALS